MRERSVSPIFENVGGAAGKGSKKGVPTMIRNGDPGGTGFQKIHRIPLVRTARCFVAHVTSPSCIWLKLVNHITSDLLIRNLNDLERMPTISERRYVMAPLESGVYARARVTNKTVSRAGRMFTKVLFIDEGYTRWVGNDALTGLPEKFAYHPWQAIAVSLFKVSPVSGKWSNEDCAILRDVISTYKLFKAEVVLNSVTCNDYREFIKVNLYGMEAETDEVGASIAYEFSRAHNANVTFERELFDANSQSFFPLAVEEELIEEGEAAAMEDWQKFIPDKQEETKESECDEWNVTGVGPQIPILDVQWLKEEGYEDNGRFLVNVEGRHTISPYEFYARPLKLEKPEGAAELDEEAAMIAANEELCAFAEQLNLFYGHPKNRNIINPQRVKTALEAGSRVYGIVEVDGDIARFTGCWQRVEILGLKHEGVGTSPSSFYCRIRFLDSGGTDIRLLSNILEINSTHCVRPPFCMQLCLHGWAPLNEGRQKSTSTAWSDEAKRFFYRELREDVPISVNILGRLNRAQDNSNLPYDCRPYRRPNVIFVSCLEVHDGSTDTLDDRLRYKRYAEAAADYPVPWEMAGDQST